MGCKHISKATRTFPSLNGDEPFPDSYDRRHDLTLVGQYSLSPTVTLSANWVMATGYPVWAPTAQYLAHNYAPVSRDGRIREALEYSG